MRKNSPSQAADEIVSDEMEGMEEPMIKDTRSRPPSLTEPNEIKGQATRPHKGAILKKVRVESGLSLEAVHEATKIPMDALRAIEDGYTVRTLSSFYYKGFLKIYARYLNVDIAQVLDEDKPEQIISHPPSSPKEKEFEFDFSWSKIFTKQRKQQLVFLLGLGLSLFILFKIIRASIHLMTSGMPRTKVVMREEKESKRKANLNNVPQSAAKKQSQEVFSRPSDPKVNQAPVASLKDIPQQRQVSSMPTVVAPARRSEEKAVTLTARAQKNSWLRVKADGAIVFQATLRQGAVETWTANQLIEITGRNIHELEFELNGKTIGSLGREDRKANRLEVTKGGLKVTR